VYSWKALQTASFDADTSTMSSTVVRPQASLGTRGETRRLMREVERAARYGELRRWRKEWVTIGNVRCYAWVHITEEETTKPEENGSERETADEQASSEATPMDDNPQARAAESVMTADVAYTSQKRHRDMLEQPSGVGGPARREQSLSSSVSSTVGGDVDVAETGKTSAQLSERTTTGNARIAAGVEELNIASAPDALGFGLRSDTAVSGFDDAHRQLPEHVAASVSSSGRCPRVSSQSEAPSPNSSEMHPIAEIKFGGSSESGAKDTANDEPMLLDGE